MSYLSSHIFYDFSQPWHVRLQAAWRLPVYLPHCSLSCSVLRPEPGPITSTKEIRPTESDAAFYPEMNSESWIQPSRAKKDWSTKKSFYLPINCFDIFTVRQTVVGSSFWNRCQDPRLFANCQHGLTDGCAHFQRKSLFLQQCEDSDTSFSLFGLLNHNSPLRPKLFKHHEIQELTAVW